MSPVLFFYADVSIGFTQRNRLKSFIPHIFKLEKRELNQLHYIFCSDDYLLSINIEFLKHDNFTDIITFDLSEPKAPCTGEIYISVDRVKENARRLKTNFEEEIRRVIFHGALHLCGYKDKKKREIEQMRNKENQYLRLFDKWI